jgi:hypothetical protein
MNATPEQNAAVEKILGAKAESENAEKLNVESRHLTPTLSPIGAERGSVSADTEMPVSEDVARSAFALLQRLELDAPLKAPSVLTVFRLYCVDGHSADRVARKCRCAKGTVMSRLRFIETVTKTKPEQFRAMSGHLQQVDDDLHASGAREIYRRGLAKSEPDGPRGED